MAQPLTAVRRLALRLSGPLLLAACATNPVTGKRELVLISEQQEIQMGQEGAAQVAQTIGLVNDSGLQRYVQGVGESLARVSQRPQLPWTFRVVDDPTPNAFALPGGYIFVTRGLMDLMTSEAELATVVGHEIGHVTARHQVRSLTRAELAQVGLALGSVLSPTIARFGQLAGTGMQLLFLKYDRAAEAQADELGFDYARRDGYDVKEMADVFEALDRVQQREGASALPGWLETHPAGPDRISKVHERVAALGDTARAVRAGIVRRPEYLRQIDSLAYGADPRQGFFQGARFVHPALRFQITFPEGWKTQNLAQAVAAASPRQDAVEQLTLADSG
ncbi:MAG TPA: M48 family metallopeptidase, partial [Longimicrobiales bacterium]